MQESGEMYLESILVLKEKQELVRAVDIGAYLGFSKPSVSRALSLLRKDEYVTVEDSGNILLTEKGKAVAERVYYNHKLLTKFLTEIGVSPETASKDACKIEHDISSESVEAIKKFLKTR